MFRKIAMLSVLALAVVLAGVLGQTKEAEAWPPDCELEGWHYAHQWTSDEANHYYEDEMGCYSSIDLNWSWAAVLGDVTVPPTLPDPAAFEAYDHIIGSVTMLPIRDGDPPEIGQIEAGVFTGRMGTPSQHIDSIGEYSIFIEVQYPNDDIYLEKFDPVVDLGSTTRFEIWVTEQSTDDVEWKVMVTPPDWEDEFEVETDPLPPTGTAIAGLEVFDYSCWYDEECDPEDVPRTTTFAYDWLSIAHWEWVMIPDPHWHLSYEPWDEDLDIGETSSYDEDGVGSDPALTLDRSAPDEYFNSFTTLSHRPCATMPWSVPPGDFDCDGFTDFEEGFMGTETLLACGTNAWPPDFNDDEEVNILDIVWLTPPHFNKCDPDPFYDPRRDFNADGCVNILDIVRMTPPMFGASCTP